MITETSKIGTMIEGTANGGMRFGKGADFSTFVNDLRGWRSFSSDLSPFFAVEERSATGVRKQNRIELPDLVGSSQRPRRWPALLLRTSRTPPKRSPKVKVSKYDF